MLKQEEKKTVTPLANKAYCVRSNHIRKSHTAPPIKCHYYHVTSEIPFLVLQGYNHSLNNIKHPSNLNKDIPFDSKYLANECLGPTTNEVKTATEKERTRKVIKAQFLTYIIFIFYTV